VVGRGLAATPARASSESCLSGYSSEEMSQQNVEILRAVYERWTRGDFRTPEVFDPDVDVVWAPAVLDVGTARGLAGLEAGLREWFKAWDHVRMQAEEYIVLEDRVLVLLTAYGRGRGSGIETEGKYAHVWTMRDGKATRIEGFTDWATARKSVGLEK
jgi:uncharacterized protein